MKKTSLTTDDATAACGDYDFNNVTDLMLFTDATWYNNYSEVEQATGLNETIMA